MNNYGNNQKRGKPRVYVRMDDWQDFLKNDYDHLRKDVTEIKINMNWIKWLVRGITIASIVMLLKLFIGG